MLYHILISYFFICNALKTSKVLFLNILNIFLLISFFNLIRQWLPLFSFAEILSHRFLLPPTIFTNFLGIRCRRKVPVSGFYLHICIGNQTSFIVIRFSVSVARHASNAEFRIRDYLLNQPNFSPRVRPVLNSSDVPHVTIMIQIYALIDLVSNNQESKICLNNVVTVCQ